MTVSFGSDCSGIGAPEVALHRLGVRYRNVFSSDIDKWARLVLETSDNPPETLFHDVTERSVDEAPTVDIYVAGFCCQSFSGLGHMRAFEDERGQVFHHIQRYIEQSQPTTFILENVHSIITQQKGEVWAEIIGSLTSILDRDTGDQAYRIEHRVLSPHQYGHPQSRQRVFIVGRHTRLGSGALTPFPFPQPTAPPPRDALASVLMDEDEARRLEPQCARNLTVCAREKLRIIKERLIARGDTWSHDCPYIVDPHTSLARIRLGMPGASLCLTTRCTEFYVLGRDRYLTSLECMRLQGFEETDFNPVVLLQKIPRSQRFKMAGNSMSVAVMAMLLKPLIQMLQRHLAVETGARGTDR